MHNLVSHFFALLDAGLEQGNAILQSVSPLIAPLVTVGLPDWGLPGAINYQGQVCVAIKQYVSLLQVGDHPGTVTESIADTRGARLLVDLTST